MIKNNNEKENLGVSNIRFFKILGCNFWNTDSDITKNYYNKVKVVKLALTKTDNESKIASLNKYKEHLDFASEVLLDPEKKAKYLRFLYLNYTCSQPLNIEKLVGDYYFQVFPYYTFQVFYGKTSTDDYCDFRILTLDYINFNFSIYNKHEIEKVVLAEVIEEVSEGDGKDEISIDLATQEKITFNVLIKNQRSLIILLLQFLINQFIARSKDPSKKGKIVEKNLNLHFSFKSNLTNSMSRSLIGKPLDEKNHYIDKLRMLENETYMPCGFLMKTELFKVGKKISIKKKRYCLLGSSNVMVFRDEEYKCLCNVIHLYPGNTLVNFYEKQMKLKFDIMYRSYNLYFNDADTMSIWESTLYDIFNKVINESIDDDFVWFDKEVKEEDLEKCTLLLEKYTHEQSVTEKKLSQIKEKRELLNEFISSIKQEENKPNSSKELASIVENNEFEKMHEKVFKNELKRKITKEG